MKKVQVIWTDESLDDLESIFDFIAMKSPESAKKIIHNILSRTSQLAAFPQAGSFYESKLSTEMEYRYLVEGHFKIIYRFADTALYIVSVIDTRQNPEASNI